jgi:hypothetical protein
MQADGGRAMSVPAPSIYIEAPPEKVRAFWGHPQHNRRARRNPEARNRVHSAGVPVPSRGLLFTYGATLKLTP